MRAALICERSGGPKGGQLDLARVAGEAHFEMNPSRKKAIVIVVDGAIGRVGDPI